MTERQIEPREYIAFLPGDGWQVLMNSRMRAHPTSQPVIAWGLTRTGEAVAFTATPDGKRTIALTEDCDVERYGIHSYSLKRD